MREILAVGLKAALATLSSLLGWLVAGKVLALSLGPAGVGLFGILRQLLLNLTLLATFNGQTSLVQGIASCTTPEERLRFSGSALLVQIVFAGLLAGGLLLGAAWLGPWLIPHPQAKPLLQWLSLATVIMVAQTFTLGILNGHRLVNDAVRSQVAGLLGVAALLLPMVWMVRRDSPMGLVVMLGGPPILVACLAAWFARRRGCLPYWTTHPPSAAYCLSFLRNSAVLLLASILTNGTQFFINWLVARQLGLNQSGLYWAAWTLCTSYVSIALSSFGTYYLPSLAGLEDPVLRRGLIRKYLRLTLIVMPLLVTAVVVFKPLAITLIFDRSFLPAAEVMRWMLLGDLIKSVSWVLAFPMLAHNHLRWFFWTELLISAGIGGASWFLLSRGSGIGVLGTLFLLQYLAHLLIAGTYVRLRHGFRWAVEDVLRLVLAIGMVVLFSAWCWTDAAVNWKAAAAFVGLCIPASILSLRKVSRRAPGSRQG